MNKGIASMLPDRLDRFSRLSRRRLLTILARGGAARASGAVSAAPERTFRFASPGNSVIVTNPTLLATDPGLPHIEELERRLDLALRNRKILDHIARTKSRAFALSSVTLNGATHSEYLYLRDFQTMLVQQSELASRDFGPMAIDDLPAYAATSIDNDVEVIVPVWDVITPYTRSFGFWPHRKSYSAWEVFCIIDDPHSRFGALDLIVLWPFKVET
jgi:hypothetical protein